ncbi:MAG TPA: bifunctional 3,4-dihydroxy-2-butanone-4-phosphate synthase/GTP cyclohydrolase II [Actinomycetales bacterium]|nr:bifunctional 3,4-dihydroxy-2-butanone-4-phosphate synthase/GTP cyclohydrolase II [Actinomycetales bacterium]
MRLDSIEVAVRELAAGRPVVVLDDEDRENEGDLVLAACSATPGWLAFVVRHSSGIVCAPMEGARADRLGLPLMVERNHEAMGTAFTVSVDAGSGVTTGISAADRARTLQLLARDDVTEDDLARPGHVFPLRARAGGVLERPGHTEAAVDLVGLAGLPPVGVIAELVSDDGSMRRAASCREFCDEHGLALISIADLVRYLRQPDPRRVATTRLPTEHGEFTAHAFADPVDGAEHVALVVGDVADRDEPVLVRVHSECLTGDVLGSLRCDCGPQLHASMEAVAAEGSGVVVYLRGHEGRGIGLGAKIAAYALQDDGADTVDANLHLGLPVDARDYGAAARVLDDLGVRTVRLLTNNPAKLEGLRAHGVDVRERVPLDLPAHAESLRYLTTKRDRLGHLLPHLAVR